jgi:hypothetical protein
MQTVTKTFSDAGTSTGLFVRKGDDFVYTVDVSSDFDGELYLERTRDNGMTYTDRIAIAADVTSATVRDAEGLYRFRVEYGVGTVALTGTAAVTLAEADSDEISDGQTLKNKLGQVVARVKERSLEVTGLDTTGQPEDATLGTQSAQPAAGKVLMTIERMGAFFRMNFTLTAAQIVVTDDTTNGSFGALKLFDFNEASLLILGCRQNYTAYAEGAALTTAAGDAVFAIGVGTDAIAAAADGVLATANKNIGASIAQTDSGGTTTGTAHTASGLASDGTGTAKDVALNWSGSAATIDATSTIAVTGTITIVGVLMGDD